MAGRDFAWHEEEAELDEELHDILDGLYTASKKRNELERLQIQRIAIVRIKEALHEPRSDEDDF